MEVNLVRVKTFAHFELIEIMDKIDPYLAPLGIDWAFMNYASINLKNETMTFEAGGIRVT